MGRPKKKVAQYDIETNELIEIYESADDAAYDNWLESTNLCKAINRNGGLIKGMKFRFVD